MKRSNVILAFLFLIVTAYISISANNAKSQVPQRHYSGRKPILGQGEYKIDTIQSQYKHIVTNFPAIKYDVRSENEFILEGYENTRPLVSAKAKNDTLYLTHTQLNGEFIDNAKINGEYQAIITLGVKNLESIHIYDRGKIFFDALPYGSDLEGNTVYKPHDIAQYKWKTDKLKIKYDNANKLSLYLDAKEVEIHPIGAGSGFNFIGKVQKLIIDDPVGPFYSSSSFKVDTAIVNTTKGHHNSGVAAFKVDSLLVANLYSNLNVSYQGQPKIQKVEKSLGRVIDLNVYKQKQEEDRLIISTDTISDIDAIKQIDSLLRQRSTDQNELIKL